MQFGLGIPAWQGRFVLEPYARYQYTASDERSHFQYGFDASVGFRKLAGSGASASWFDVDALSWEKSMTAGDARRNIVVLSHTSLWATSDGGD